MSSLRAGLSSLLDGLSEKLRGFSLSSLLENLSEKLRGFSLSSLLDGLSEKLRGFSLSSLLGGLSEKLRAFSPSSLLGGLSEKPRAFSLSSLLEGLSEKLRGSSDLTVLLVLKGLDLPPRSSFPLEEPPAAALSALLLSSLAENLAGLSKPPGDGLSEKDLRGRSDC